MALRTSGEEEKGHENPLLSDRPTGPRRSGGTASAAELLGAEENPKKNDQGVVGALEKGLVRGGLGSMIHKPSQGIIGLAAKMFQSKRARNGGLIGGGVVVSSIVLIMTFSPVLRLDHMFQNINNRAFAAAGSAVEYRMEHLFERYILLKIINMRSCTALVSNNCRANYANAGIATNMFNAWRDARIEDKMFAKMGLTVESTRNPDRAAGVHSFTLKDRNGKTVTFNNTGDWERFKEGQFKGGKREFGREMRKALRDTTMGLNVMQRKQVRKYLERKHGIKTWCFLACKQKDSAEEKIKDSKTRYKYKFVEKFVYPFSAKYGLVMDCIISGGVDNKSKCGPERLAAVGLETDISDDERQKILKTFEETPDIRLGQVMISNLLERIMSRQAARSTVSAIPVAGQIYLALYLVDGLDKMDSFVKDHGLSKFAADLNRTQYIQYYSAMRSDSDGLKKGALSLDDLGAEVSEFDGAEKSRVWQAYNSKPETTASLFSPSAYAQGAPANGDKGYLCADENPIPDNEFVCEEKKIARTYKVEDWRNNDIVDGIATTLNTYGRCFVGVPLTDICAKPGRPRDVIRPLLNATNWAADTIVGTALDVVLGGVKLIPGIGDGVKEVESFVSEKFGDILQMFMGKIFPLPLQADSQAREKYDGLEAGGDIAGSEFAKGGYSDDGDSYGQGAPQVSDEEFAAIYQDYLEQEEYEFKNSDFINKIANIHEPKSLASKMAFNVPSNLSSVFLSVLSAPENLLKLLGNIPNILFNPSAGAQSLAERQGAINAFGVTRYAYPLGHSAITADPAKYTPEYCEKLAEARLDSASEHELTGFEEYSKADPCSLEKVVVDSGCALFTAGNECGEEAPSDGVSGDAQSLAKAIIESGKVTGDSRYMAQLEAVSKGNFECNVSPYILEMLASIVDEGHSLHISSLNRRCTGVLTASGEGSYHYREGGGHAIDITSFDGKPTTGGANTIPYWRAAIPFLPDGTGIGQVDSCGSGFKLPSGFSPIPDSCDHAHIQVPVKKAEE